MFSFNEIYKGISHITIILMIHWKIKKIIYILMI